MYLPRRPRYWSVAVPHGVATLLPLDALAARRVYQSQESPNPFNQANVPRLLPPESFPMRLPRGFQAAGVYSGVKRTANKLDLSLIVSDRPAVRVGFYTQTLVCAAPVKLDRRRTPSDAIRCVAINSGVANACTGEQGDRDAEQMAAWAAEAVGVAPEQALLMSTGVIGEMLPMEKIRAGIAAAARELGGDEPALERAARGMMTTDTVPKIRGRVVSIDGQQVAVVGIAKGAAMIGPNMSTMLAVVLTDAALTATDAQAALFDAVDDSFNCISVDGHMSTNDTVLLLANGAAGEPALQNKALAEFRATLDEVCA